MGRVPTGFLCEAPSAVHEGNAEMDGVVGRAQEEIGGGEVRCMQDEASTAVGLTTALPDDYLWSLVR